MRLEELLYKPANSLVVQSKQSQMGAETVNGDGFGVGWYGSRPTPGIYRSSEPAWNDRNLHELSAQASAGRVFAHIRASTGSPIQQSNCNRSAMRTGWDAQRRDRRLTPVKRDLTCCRAGLTPHRADRPTRSVLLLALTFGSPRTAVPGRRGWDFIEESVAATAPPPHCATVATTDGETTWGVRYEVGKSRRYSAAAPDVSRCASVSRECPAARRSTTLGSSLGTARRPARSVAGVLVVVRVVRGAQNEVSELRRSATALTAHSSGRETDRVEDRASSASAASCRRELPTASQRSSPSGRHALRSCSVGRS